MNESVLGRTAQVDPDALEAVLASRRTVHDFTTEAPPADIVESALETARWAPNHHLTQPWRFYLLGPETSEQIARLNSEIVAAKRGAEAGQEKYQRWSQIPGWMVVTCENHDDPVRSREDYAACCCAIHNFSLAMWGHGLGVKWTTGPVTRADEFYDLIWVDATVETVVGLVWFGYPEVVPQLARRPLEEVVVRLP
ncbi:MAG: nitroreductase [Pseudomonadota bacterium]